MTDDFDFFERDTDRRAEAEVVIGDLSDELRQLFFDELEWWDLDDDELIEETDDVEKLDALNCEPALRICYRAVWSDADEHANQWVDFPKMSDPDQDIFVRLTRAQREAFPSSSHTLAIDRSASSDAHTSDGSST